jgi:hypothetical protein
MALRTLRSARGLLVLLPAHFQLLSVALTLALAARRGILELLGAALVAVQDLRFDLPLDHLLHPLEDLDRRFVPAQQAVAKVDPGGTLAFVELADVFYVGVADGERFVQHRGRIHVALGEGRRQYPRRRFLRRFQPTPGSVGFTLAR